MAVTTLPTQPRPWWPDSRSSDPAHTYVSYDPPADELIVYFDGKPVPKVVSPIDSPKDDFAAIMVGVNWDESSTGEVVGIQVVPFLVGAVQTHPAWAVLAWGALTDFRYEEEMLRAALGAFVAEVHDLFEQHWAPPPPLAEQVARRPHAARNAAGETTP